MATGMINIRLEKKFLNEIDCIVKKENYQSRTELIRKTLREEIERSKIKEALLNLKGSLKSKTTDKDLEKMREKAFNELYSKVKWVLLVFYFYKN